MKDIKGSKKHKSVSIDTKAAEINLINNAISTRLMLIVGEVAEAQEALRKDDQENFAEELADVVIRLFDLCGGLGIDLETEIKKKMDKNKLRPYKHGKQF
jgi:NTP pyrophosphatase (non-canonical NTP hydrolase)